MNDAQEFAGGPMKKSANELHALAVGAALLLGAIGAIFAAQPLCNPENVWHAPTHEYLNALLPKEWRWYGKNAILVAATVSLVAVPTFLAYICIPNPSGSMRGGQRPEAGARAQSSAHQD